LGRWQQVVSVSVVFLRKQKCL